LTLDRPWSGEREVDIDRAPSFTSFDLHVGSTGSRLFLDACRDNPFAAKIKSNATRSVSVQQGLAEMKSGEGTLIAFATGPGQTALDGQEGTNSPFTRALMAHITSPAWRSSRR